MKGNHKDCNQCFIFQQGQETLRSLDTDPAPRNLEATPQVWWRVTKNKRQIIRTEHGCFNERGDVKQWELKLLLLFRASVSVQCKHMEEFYILTASKFTVCFSQPSCNISHFRSRNKHVGFFFAAHHANVANFFFC